MNAPISSTVGPKPRSRLSHHEVSPSLSALTTTPWSSRRRSRSSSANVGRCVLNSSDVRDSAGAAGGAASEGVGGLAGWAGGGVTTGGGYVTAVLNRPVMLSPELVTSSTLPASICALKTVYGIVTDEGVGKSRRDTAKLTMPNRMKSIHNGGMRFRNTPDGAGPWAPEPEAGARPSSFGVLAMSTGRSSRSCGPRSRALQTCPSSPAGPSQLPALRPFQRRAAPSSRSWRP